MEFWVSFDKYLGPLNLIDRVEGKISALRHGDYASAKEHGTLGVGVEVMRSALGTNTVRFAVIRGRRHSLFAVEDLLQKYGIPLFGRTHDDRNMYFSVKKRQARWAEYILLNAGVELDNPTFDRRNPGYVGRHGPGWMPTPWAEQDRTPTAKAPAAEVPAAKPTSSLGRLSRWMDELLED